jgi:hypothetical protein
LVTIHIAGDADRLSEAYSRHADDVWPGDAECRSHLAARMPDGFLIADEWVSEAGFRSRYEGSPLERAFGEGGAAQVHVATIVDRRPPRAGAPAEAGASMDEAALAERVVPRDS